jgi:UDP:flavonoid glycosyltransferase YjiC (YdhE family)
MPKILIDIMPAKGHFHATLKIATKLRDAGYEVVYGSHNYLKYEIEKFGFNFVSLPILSVVKVNFRMRISKLHRMATFFYWFVSGEKVLNSLGDIREFQTAFNEIQPDMVLLDEQEALKALFYDSDKTKIVFFQTKPDTRKIEGIPPFTSYYLPKGWFNGFISKILWCSKLCNYTFSYLFNRTLTFGQDNFSVLKKIDKEIGVNLRGRIDIKRSFGVGVKNIPRIVISPAAFDFPHPEKENVFRIGPLIDIKREGKINQHRYINLLKRLELAKKNNSFIVYCSLGTITAKFEGKVKRFFKKIAKVAVLNPDCLFILSTGPDFDISVLFPAPGNLFIYDYVPQVELLKHCSLMITHGGMNSITECIYNDVPLLVYPLSPRWDQPGNSARAVYHELGLRGKIKMDTAKSISKKLNTIRTNYDYYQKNVISIKEKFEKKNNSNQILDIVQDILNES